MKKEELKSLMDQALEKAKILLLRDGHLVPVAFMHCENNIDVIGLSFKDRADKNRQLSFLKKLVKKKNADAIFIVTESWVITSDTEDLTIEPSKHPMRKECIFIYGECEEGDITIMQIFDKKNEEFVFGERVEHIGAISLKFDFGIKDKKKQNKDLSYLS